MPLRSTNCRVPRRSKLLRWLSPRACSIAPSFTRRSHARVSGPFSLAARGNLKLRFTGNREPFCAAWVLILTFTLQRVLTYRGRFRQAFQVLERLTLFGCKLDDLPPEVCGDRYDNVLDKVPRAHKGSEIRPTDRHGGQGLVSLFLGNGGPTPR
jgi:hypothetical protein